MSSEARRFVVNQERLIPVRRERVVAYATDPANDLAWIRGTRWVRVLTDGPVEVADRVDRKATFLGWRFSYTLRIVDIEPGYRVVMQTGAGPLTTVSYEFEDAEGGTVMRIGVSGGAGRMGPLKATFLSAAVGLTLTRSLRTLEDRLLEG